MLGWSRSETPPVVPVRGYLEGIRRLMKGDHFIGRSCRQRGLPRSVFGNPYTLSVYGRAQAVRRYAATLARDDDLRAKVWSLAGCWLVYHCAPEQECHADIIIAEYRRQFPDAYDRDGAESPVPSSSVLNLLSRLREEPDSSDGSSADEAAPPKTAGWRGTGKPMEVGLGYTSREICDGQGLASPGRWSPEERRYPDTALWKAASEPILPFPRRCGTTALLSRLAMGQVTESPFEEGAVTRLKEQVVRALAENGLHLNRHPEDRTGLPVDFRFLQLLLSAAEDPEVSLGDFARGVRVGPGARLPRQPALYPAKKKWSLKEKYDGADYLTPVDDEEATWRKNHSSIEPWVERVLEVLEDQSSRGQVLKLTETEARGRFPDLVASLGAIRKDKPGGGSSAPGSGSTAQTGSM